MRYTSCYMALKKLVLLSTCLTVLALSCGVRPALATCGPGDINNDCTVNIYDFQVLIQHFQLTSADPEFYAPADLDQDGVIDILDFAVLISNFTNVYPTPTPLPPSATPTQFPPTLTPTTAPTPTPNSNAVYPSDTAVTTNWRQWKINLPDGSEVKNLIDFKDDDYFYVNGSGTGVIFKAPILSNNGTTPNSSYIRSELREREPDGSKDVYWTTAGKHVLYVKQKINHLPINKPHLVASQIHGCKSCGGDVGSVDDSAVLRLEGTHLFISFNGGKEMTGSNGQKVSRQNVTITRSYQLGTVHEFIMEIVNDEHRFYYSEDGKLESAYTTGNASQYLVKDGTQTVLLDLPYKQAYFKAGNYTQSNKDTEGSDTGKPNNYGEVELFKLWVRHN